MNLADIASQVINLDSRKVKPMSAKAADLAPSPKRERNFTVLPARAIRDKRINTKAAYFVLSAICTYTNRHGETWVSQQTVADLLDVSKQAIQRQVKILIDLGYVQLLEQGHRHRSSRYRVVFDESLTIDDVKANTPVALQENNTPPPRVLSKEESAAKLKALKEQIQRQPDVLSINPSQRQHDGLSLDQSKDNKNEVYRQQNRPQPTTSDVVRREVEVYIEGCTRAWEQTQLKVENEIEHLRAIETVAQWGIPERSLVSLLNHIVLQNNNRSLPQPTSMDFLARMGETAAWELISRVQQ